MDREDYNIMNIQGEQQTAEVRTYAWSQCAVFKRPEEMYGSLANTALGFPIAVNDVRVSTLEHLYHACKFPHLTNVQREILNYCTWKEAKDTAIWYKTMIRPDWDSVKVETMRWCLRLKLAQHWATFGGDLLSTGDLVCVENSRVDAFWGAQPDATETLLTGKNMLGILLMDLREKLRGPHADDLRQVSTPPVPDFLLLGQLITTPTIM